MFEKLSRSWYLSKVSYGIIWNNKRLLVFPLVSTVALLLVLASFLGGSLALGAVTTTHGAHGRHVEVANQALAYGLSFAFYFVSYFTIVFFNCGLTACALRALRGESPTVGDGFSAAAARLPQIAGWAALSAVVGVLLRAIENAHERAGWLVSSIIGSTWSVLTFFVVPVLVVEGAGPVEAVKRSGSTLRKTWGEAAVGHVSLGLIATLIVLPILLLTVTGAVFAASTHNALLVGVVIGIGVLALATASAFSAAADVVFKALLYTYATGKELPATVDARVLQGAFGRR